jgi:hypothetical protein
MQLIQRNDLVERIFLPWRVRLGPACEPYKGHVYRTLNYTCAILDNETASHGERVDADCVAVAACFHDVGIWLDRTMDYLEPSIRHADDWIIERRRDEWREPVRLMIEQHHKLFSYAGPHAACVEAFRRADRMDVLFGIPGEGLPRDFIREVKQTFPTRGFHRILVKGLTAYGLRHPLNPLPMMRR